MSNQQQQNNNKKRNSRGGNGARSTSGGGGKSKSGGGDNKGSNQRRRKGPRKKKIDPQLFWGNPEVLADYEPPSATITSNPSAVVLSLGRPPLSGQQNASELYFTAVYDRAVNLAAALAAAGDLLDPEETLGISG